MAAAVALAWANAPWSEAYHDLWDSELGPLDLRHRIDDALMSLFFVVVALEIKRKSTTGELRERRHAALPVFAAIGGMLIPAAVYMAVTAGRVGGRGWGIPMATDIAFSLGVAALVGRALPSGLRVFAPSGIAHRVVGGRPALVDEPARRAVVRPRQRDEATVGVLAASLPATGVAAVILLPRAR